MCWKAASLESAVSAVRVSCGMRRLRFAAVSSYQGRQMFKTKSTYTAAQAAGVRAASFQSIFLSFRGFGIATRNKNGSFSQGESYGRRELLEAQLNAIASDLFLCTD